MNIDETIHRIYRFLKNFKPVHKIQGTEITYYYCEERLYLLCFPDGKIAFSDGRDPKDALDNCERLQRKCRAKAEEAI